MAQNFLPRLHQPKKPLIHYELGAFDLMYLGFIYFPACDCSIINGSRLNFSVRDGKR